jgi:hypothetical protein
MYYSLAFTTRRLFTTTIKARPSPLILTLKAPRNKLNDKTPSGRFFPFPVFTYKCSHGLMTTVQVGFKAELSKTLTLKLQWRMSDGVKPR